MEKDSNKPYIFRVTLVIDGHRSGILLERYKKGEIQPTYGYFWLDEPLGLAPTDSIRQKCGENCESIKLSKNYKEKPKISAKLYHQERIFRELLAYTKAAAGNKKALSKYPVTQDYFDHEKGYPGILSRFFSDGSSKFRQFIINLHVYTRCILRKGPGDDSFIGEAELFEIRNLYNLFPKENFNYLYTVDKVLLVDNPPEPTWFRENGPVISDFVNKKVYIRNEVSIIIDQLLRKSFCILRGNAASGKTVLVRTLMYVLYKNQDIYYFDIDSYRDFDQSRLVDDIRSVKGVFIIENIHLEPQKAQWIYMRFSNDPDRHILFVSRPGFEIYQNKGILPDLETIDQLNLSSFADIEKMFKSYCDDPAVPKVVWDRRHDIINHYADDLWLLACALKGCATLGGDGDPKQWVQTEVNKRLQNLEHCKDPFCDQYPGIIMSLSPLYINEILTAETFLLKLGFSKAALNQLTERGEIKKQKEKDDVFYGLAHSSLADAYWAHGKEYIKDEFRNITTFILDYVQSGTKNCLRALLSLDPTTRKYLLKELNKKGDLSGIIKNELSISAITMCLLETHSYFRQDINILTTAVQEFVDNSDFIEFTWAFNYIWKKDQCLARKIWVQLDKKRIAYGIMRLPDPLAFSFILAIKGYDEDITGEVFWSVSPRELAEYVENKSTVKEMVDYLRAIDITNRTVAENVCSELISEIVANKIDQNKQDFLEIYNFMELLDSLDSQKSLEVCGLLNDEKLSKSLINLINTRK